MSIPPRARLGMLVSRRVIDECRRTTTGCPGPASVWPPSRRAARVVSTRSAGGTPPPDSRRP